MENNKSVVRRKYRDLRIGLSNEERSSRAKSLEQNLVRFLSDYPKQPKAIYKPLPEEAACVEDADCYYPYIAGENLEFLKPRSPAGFQVNSFSIPEPIPSQSTKLDTSKPAVVCCPAVAIDRSGLRLGMGKGFYDRFFSEHPQMLRVGVIYHVQLSGQPLPAESWDQAVDWIVTDEAILRTSSPTRSSLSWI